MRGLSLFTTELLKQKRNFIWLVVFMIPLGTTGAMMLDMYLRYENYLYGQAVERGITSWEILMQENHSVLGWGMFLPVFVAVISATLHHTELQNHSWKHLLSLPVTKTAVYSSKFLTIILFSWLMIALNAVGLFLVGKVIGFPEAFAAGHYLKYVLFEFISIVGIAALHHWLGSVWNNMILPVVIGFGGTIVSAILLFRPDFAVWFPYSFPVFAAGLHGYDPIIAVRGGLVSGLLLFIAGSIAFSRKDVM